MQFLNLNYLRMKELGIKRDDKVICFGQLYGMCDQISFLLGITFYLIFEIKSIHIKYEIFFQDNRVIQFTNTFHTVQ